MSDTSAITDQKVPDSTSNFLVKLLNPAAKPPVRGSSDAAGYDLHAFDEELQKTDADTTPLGVVHAHSRAIVKTGISVAIPEGYYGRVAPRSGLAVKAGIDVGAGVIDRDYRGEVGVVLFNHSDKDFTYSNGDRIAQLILTAYASPAVTVVDNLDDTYRGSGGFGSTGKN